MVSDLKYKNLPINTAFVGVCMFFFDNTMTMAELATRVMSMKKGAIKPTEKMKMKLCVVV
jgi:hypothetical protein